MTHLCLQNLALETFYDKKIGGVSIWLTAVFFIIVDLCTYPPASEASREVSNLAVRKNPHTLVYGVKDYKKNLT